MATDAAQRSQSFFADMMGVSRATVRRVTFSNLTLAAALVGSLGWNFYLVQTTQGRIERYVVALDDTSQVVFDARGGQAWRPGDGLLVKFAQDWVRYLRTWPRDPETLKFLWQEVIRTSDQRLHTQLLAARKAVAEKLRGTTVTVSSISANVVNRSGDRATVLVRWTEEATGATTQPATYTAILDVLHQPPEVERELRQNPVGLFVTGFQPTMEEK